MKKTLIFCLLLTALFLFGCASTPRSSSGSGIVKKDYHYEKTFYDTHTIEFEIHLENIRHNDSAAGLIERLVYQNKNFDDYAGYVENKFVEDRATGFYRPIFYDDGTQYYYHSSMSESFIIDYHDDDYVIIHYSNHYYNSGAAHGNYWIEYYIIDIAAEKILSLNEIIAPVPDAILISLIKSEYDIENFLRDNIWAPDSINISKDGVSLLWNIYTISPYVIGDIYISLPHSTANTYLTEKGRQILSRF